MSPAPSSHNHVAQLIWTGLVALALGTMALQQTTEPRPSPMDSLLIANPLMPDSFRDQRSPAFTPGLPGRNVPAQ